MTSSRIIAIMSCISMCEQTHAHEVNRNVLLLPLSHERVHCLHIMQPRGQLRINHLIIRSLGRIFKQ